MIFYLWVGCDKEHLSRLCDKIGNFVIFRLEFLSSFCHSFAKWSLSTGPVQASLSIKPSLNNIKRRCGNRSQSSCYSTTKIVAKMIVSLFDFEKFLQFLIHQHNYRTKRYIHKVVDKEASIEWDDALIFIHQFNELTHWDPFAFCSINL